MNLSKYQTFLKVVELGSLTRAAEALGYTQSGVSHIIGSLEDELGFTLLIRSRAGVQLTADGERILPAVRGIINGMSQLDQIVAAIRGLDTGLIRVGTFTSVAVHWLPGMMQEFQAQYPRVEFKLFNGDYHDVDRWLTDGSVDVGFITLPTDLRCECIPLREDRLLAVLPAGHPLAERKACPVKEVAAEPFITLLETSDNDSRRVLDAAGVKPNIRFTTKDDYAIIAMVEQGLGVSIMPELLLRGRGDGVALRPLDPPASRMLALAVPAGALAGPATRRFAEYAAEWVRKNS